MKSFEHLFEGLTIRRVLWVTVVAAAAAGAVVWLFINTYLDLLVTALCVGYTSMVLFTVAGNIRQSRVPREAMQILAIIAGSVLGTILAGLVKGRAFSTMFSERMWVSSGATASIGIENVVVNDATGTGAAGRPAEKWARPLRSVPGEKFAYDNAIVRKFIVATSVAGAPCGMIDL